MPAPRYSDVHVNRPLGNLSVAYIQSADNFIAGQVFPVIPVPNKSDLYFIYNLGDFFRDEAQPRAPGAESAGGGYSLTTDSYNAVINAFHKDIDDPTAANADSPLSMDRDAAIFVTQKLLLRKENLWVSKYFTTSVWGTDLTGESTSPSTNQFLQWDQSGSNPVGDVDVAKADIAEATGYQPNTLVMGVRVFNALRNNADIKDRVKYTQRANITTDILASLFNVERVLVPWATANSAPKGETATNAFLYGKNALLCYSERAPGVLKPSAGYTFSWTGYLGAGAADIRMKRFRMEELESWRIEGEMAFDQKLVSSALGVFYSGCIA